MPEPIRITITIDTPRGTPRPVVTVVPTSPSRTRAGEGSAKGEGLPTGARGGVEGGEPPKDDPPAKKPTTPALPKKPKRGQRRKAK